MNRIRKHCNALLGLLLWLPAAAGAHVGERLYPVSYLSDEMLAEVRIDGRVEEWSELLGEPAMTTLDFGDIISDEPADPASLDFRIWLAWHDDPARFYLAFVAADDVYENAHDYSVLSQSVMSFYDSMGLAIDADHSGGPGCYKICEQGGDEWPEAKGQTQYYSAVARTVDGPILDDAGTRVNTGEFAWTVFPPYGEGAGSVAGEAPYISVIEFYVTPFDWWVNGYDRAQDNAISELTARQVIGFGVVVYDYDPPQKVHDEDYLMPQGVERTDLLFLRGDGLLDGILLPVEPEGSAVEGSTWGRIKASLTVE